MYRKIRLAAGVAAAAVAVTFGAVGIAGATSSGQTFTACVRFNVEQHIYNTNHSCPNGQAKYTWNQIGPQGPQGIQGIQGVQGVPGPSDLTVSASTSLSNRDDSGGQGNWALDAFIRNISITRHEAADVSHCGGAVATCWYYTGTITDSGSFLTGAGDKTPNSSCTEPAPSGAACSGLVINGQVAGEMSGGSHIEFYASSNAPNPSLVPSSVSGDSPSTGDWYQQFFPGGTAFSGPANLIDWSWTYTAPSTCEKWTDAYNNGDGSGTYAADGNIAGINECPV